MTYDGARRKVLLFGGADDTQVCSDTWEWDGKCWNRLSSTGPGPRTFAALAYDSVRKRVVLFGGNRALFGKTEEDIKLLGDTWEWDGQKWLEIKAPGPLPRAEAAMTFDRKRRRVLLFGGYNRSGSKLNRLGDTWEWDGVRWNEVKAPGPSPRSGAAMTWDDERGKAVLFGGQGSSAETWEWGGKGWVSFTWFQPHRLAWLEMGGVYAQPSLRGGGEYGETWHQAGIKRNKQNTIDDYLAAAEWLIANKYTSAKKLVATGGSLSGPLAAAATQQRPDMFGASAISIPVLDLLRFDQFTGGAYWRSELGSPSDPAEFKTLLASSPYHNVKSGKCYPPTLVMAGELDQTAVSTHAWKFTAAMQAAQGCDNAVLLKTMKGAGHNYGGTAEQTVDSYTDELMFLARTLRLSPALLARQ